MSLIYTREPIEDGDIGVWAEKLLPQNRKSEGVLTANLYDASGDLRLKNGLIGYSNAAGFEQGASDDRGIILNDAELTISLSLCSVSTWCKVTAEIVAGAAQIAVSDVSDSVDANELPTSFKDAFDGEKGGFYSGDLRIIGIAWRNAAGTLEGVINCKPFLNGWIGYSQSNDAVDIPYKFEKSIEDSLEIEGERTDFTESVIQHRDSAGTEASSKTIEKVVEIGDWNMDTTLSVAIAHGLGTAWKNIRSINAIIRNDSDDAYYDLQWTLAQGVGLESAGSIDTIDSTTITLRRASRAVSPFGFDSPDFDATSYNRGWLYIVHETGG